MDKQNLLTIGNLSKQTGVHVKSLRYYEQLGILLPAYTDPDTGYRYYTLSQIPVVDTIRACIFLDIPLKEFTGFLTRDQRRIHYKKLFSHGTMLAHRKIRDIQEKLRLLEKFRKQMDRGEDLLLHGEQAIHALPEKYCWVLKQPFFHPLCMLEEKELFFNDKSLTLAATNTQRSKTCMSIFSLL